MRYEFQCNLSKQEAKTLKQAEQEQQSRMQEAKRLALLSAGKKLCGSPEAQAWVKSNIPEDMKWQPYDSIKIRYKEHPEVQGPFMWDVMEVSSF